MKGLRTTVLNVLMKIWYAGYEVCDGEKMKLQLIPVFQLKRDHMSPQSCYHLVIINEGLVYGLVLSLLFIVNLSLSAVARRDAI